MESRFWRRAARRRLGRFLIKIRRSASACVIACSVARILSSWREGDDRRERREGDSRKPRPRRRPPLAGETHVAPPIESSHWGARVVAVGTRRRRPFRRGEGGRDGARRRASEGGSPAPLQSLLGSHLELLCALQKCPLLHSSSLSPRVPPLAASRILIVSRTFATTAADDDEDYSSNTRSGGGGGCSDNKT